MTEAEKDDSIPESRKKIREQEVSLIEFWNVFARRKRFIVISTLGATMLGAIIAFLLPNQYTAETLILPPTQGSSASSIIMSQLGSGALASLAGGSLGIKNPGSMYVSLFRSRTVEDSVIHRFGLMARYKKKRMTDARGKLESRIVITLGVRDGLISISARDPDPQMAANIANGFVDEFRKLSDNLAITEAAQRRQFFQQQLEEAKANLTNAEIAMRNTQQSTGVLQIDSQSKALIESAATLHAQVVAKQVQLQGLRTFATDDNPEVITTKQELVALQEQLANLGGMNQDLSSDLVIPKGKIPEAGMEYIRKYRDVKYFENVYGLIAKQLEIAKLDEAREGPPVQVVDVAIPPDKKSSPHRALIILLVFLFSLAISSVFVLAHNRISRTEENPWSDRSLAPNDPRSGP